MHLSWVLMQQTFSAKEKTNRVVGHQGGKFVDFDIDEALAMQKDIDDYEYSVSRILSDVTYVQSRANLYKTCGAYLYAATCFYKFMRRRAAT